MPMTVDDKTQDEKKGTNQEGIQEPNALNTQEEAKIDETVNCSDASVFNENAAELFTVNKRIKTDENESNNSNGDWMSISDLNYSDLKVEIRDNTSSTETEAATNDLVKKIDAAVEEPINKIEIVSKENTDIKVEAGKEKLKNKKSVDDEDSQVKFDNQMKLEELLHDQENLNRKRMSIRERRMSSRARTDSHFDSFDPNALQMTGMFDNNNLYKSGENNKEKQRNIIHGRRTNSFKAAFNKVISNLQGSLEKANNKLAEAGPIHDSYSITVDSVSHNDISQGNRSQIDIEAVIRKIKASFREMCQENELFGKLDHLDKLESICTELPENGELNKEVLETHYGDIIKEANDRIDKLEFTAIQARNNYLDQKIIEAKTKLEYKKLELKEMCDNMKEGIKRMDFMLDDEARD